MSYKELLSRLENNLENVEFNDVIDTITANFDYTPTRFSNGDSIVNEAGSNEGSCKIFAFAKIAQLSPAQTLACFGKYYREDVLAHPEASDHGNIRSFMVNGWAGISFDGEALTAK